MNRPAQLAVAALLAAAAFAPAVRAQNVAPTVTISDQKFLSLSQKDCLADPQDSFTITWTHPTLVAGMREKVFLAPSDSCTETESGVKVLIAERPVSKTSNTFPDTTDTKLTPSEFFDIFGAGCPADLEKLPAFCVKVTNDNLTSAAAAFGKLRFTADSKPPPVPTGVTVDPLDSALLVGWTMPSDVQGATHFNVHVVGPDGTDKVTGVAGASSRSASIEGLKNLTTYTVTVTSLDAVGTQAARNNESAASTAATGAPQPTDDFWALYKDAGGAETGGCAAADASVLGLVVAAALALKRRKAAVLAAALALTIPGSAKAMGGGPAFLHSPRHFTFTIQTGTYEPNVDDEAALNGSKPFATIFGTDKSRFLWRTSLNYDLFDRFGRASLGLSAGFWQAVGKGRLQSDPTVASKDTILFNLWPITPQVTYRADFVFERWGVPLVPYVRAGYGFAHWATFKKDSSPTSIGDAKAEGWAKGIEYGAGLEVVLDALEPDKAASLDQDFGINSTAAFIGWDGMQWTGHSGLLLHGQNVNFGLLFAF